MIENGGNLGTEPTGEEWPEGTVPQEVASSFEYHAKGEPHVNWLFVDLNSYFASVEQQDRPELRGKPVGVVPMLADTTCCIAASYEAKAHGVKTGTMVAEAKRMCPNIIFVEGRHEIYVDYHHRIVEAVESCLPVTAVMSIDEMACRLMGRERPLLSALELGRKVKATVRERVGPMLRSSVGLATSRYLAKVASDMEKPDGLVALTLDMLPDALRKLSLRDLPGIGVQTEKRLNEKGIHTMDDLLELNCEQSGEMWGSVWGERLWHWLRGEDFEMSETEHLKSISHSHVLAPEMRTTEKAWAVAHKLLHKAAMSLRMEKFYTAAMHVTIRYQLTREQAERMKSQRHFSGIRHSGWGMEARFAACQDTLTLLNVLRGAWTKRPDGPEFMRPFFVGVTMHELIPESEYQATLFGDPDNRAGLAATMDKLNLKYGHTTLHFAGMLPAKESAPTRIAFTQIPVQYGVDYM